jgi:hypothetical protein
LTDPLGLGWLEDAWELGKDLAVNHLIDLAGALPAFVHNAIGFVDRVEAAEKDLRGAARCAEAYWSAKDGNAAPHAAHAAQIAACAAANFVVGCAQFLPFDLDILADRIYPSK